MALFTPSIRAFRHFLWAVLLGLALPMPAWSLDVAFDFESGVAGMLSKNVQQTKSGETLAIVSVSDTMSGALAWGDTAIGGAESLFLAYAGSGETSVTFSLVSGKQFDVNLVTFKELYGQSQTLTLTSSKGSLNFSWPLGTVNTFVVSSDGNAARLQGITSFTITGSPSPFAVAIDGISLTNIAGAPSATTNAASALSATGATLNGTVNDNGADTTVTFDYGLTAAYGTNASPNSGASVLAGSGATAAALALAGLTCNTTYHYRVKGVNSVGTTNGSDASFTTSACVPGAPTIGTATAGDGQASVAFSAPGSNGGAAITGYTVTASPGGATGTGAASPIAVTGLTNGQAYTFTVTATNSAGTGAASAPSNSATPKAGQTITFTNPGAQNFGTSPSLSATSTSGLTVTFSSSTTGVCTITSGGALTFVAAGTCTIDADQSGDGTYSAASTVSRSFAVNAVVPGAPAIGTATAGDTQATVTFSAPGVTGGASITSFTVTASPGGATGSGAGSPITVTGLTNGVSYTFSVTASNSAGTGAASAASNIVVPKAGQTITFSNPGAQTFGTTPTLTATSDSGLTVSFSSSTTGVCTITSGGVLAFVTAGTCTVHADQAGNGSYLSATQVSRSFTVNPVVPGAPTAAIATAGDTQASVAFVAPVFTGGTSITGYTVAVTPPDVAPVNGASSPIVVTGLTNGQAYTFKVTADNSAGTGPASSDSNSITPKSTQTITFANPGAQNFGTTPTLTATSDSGLTVTFASSTTGVCSITSGGALTFVTTGSCTINADQAGNGSYLAATQVSRTFAINPVVPGAPSAVGGTAGDAQVTLSWSPPASNGGSVISGYNVQVATVVGGPYANAAGGCAPATTNASNTVTCRATGLVNGTAYFFKVAAINVVGTSSYSAASVGVVPVASTPAPLVVPPMPVAVPGVNGAPAVANLTQSDGPVVLGGMRTLLSTALGSELQFIEQTPQGTVVMSGLGNGNLAFMPHSYQTGDTRTNGIYPLGDGRYQVVNNGTVVTIAPAVVHLDQLVGLLPGVNATQSESGVLTAVVGDVTYVVQPGVSVGRAAATGTPRLVIPGADGYMHFVDAQGNDQILYPAFREYSTLRAALLGTDPAVSLVVELDGTITMISRAVRSALVPEVTLIAVPIERLGQPLWQDSANRWCYANVQFQPVAGRAQCYSIR